MLDSENASQRVSGAGNQRQKDEEEDKRVKRPALSDNV